MYQASYPNCSPFFYRKGPGASLGSSVNQTIFLWNPAVKVDFIGDVFIAMLVKFGNICKENK
jgi:hypothetical protein